MAASPFSNFQMVIVPGLHNSGPGHWQTRWQRLYPNSLRVEQDKPDLAAWSARLESLLQRNSKPAILVAHSFGCLTSVACIASNSSRIAGALLVAPADPEKFGVAHLLPAASLAVPTLMISSSDDPWMSCARAASWARRWGSVQVDGGALGHINAESGLEDWRFGQVCMQRLLEMTHNEMASH